MMTKKRRKSSRFRGSHTHGRGFKKKARGSGHRGGFGMAGTGKRGDQKKTLVLNEYPTGYFGKSKTWRKPIPIRLKVINLRDISANFDSFIKKGKIKKEGDSFSADFTGYKILSEGEAPKKLRILASGASKSAIDKIKKAGGDILVKG
jgi:large subunit ribosomal protein L15